MASSIMASVSLKPTPFTVQKSSVKGLPSISRPFRVVASGIKKIKTDTPYGTGGGMDLPNGLDASGRKQKGKGVYQFVDKYGANVDGYSPIYEPKEWSATGDVYAGGTTGLAIWAVTLAGLLAGGFTFGTISEVKKKNSVEEDENMADNDTDIGDLIQVSLNIRLCCLSQTCMCKIFISFAFDFIYFNLLMLSSTMEVSL
ncbi:unnamed protein product [Vicia faba]|uniref:Photosystem II 10 kDa polypeptide, chloroplastic n=1 Tax=Vicia faba TaxID=3906 RepID=A0AAV0ZF14_VICFA|nr:unnamed protein product [Vicia faba]